MNLTSLTGLPGTTEIEVAQVRDVMAAQLMETLSALGKGHSEMDSCAYDTAWLARLVPDFQDGTFDGAREWLRENQHQDGSWGGRVVHYHDRMICTLGAVVALHTAGNGAHDKERVDRGLAYVWHEHKRLSYDLQDTIGYPVLATLLSKEARLVGLDVPGGLVQDAGVVESKLNLLVRQIKDWRQTTMSFSMEAIFVLRDEIGDVLPFIDSDGSVGCSPAAAAAILVKSGQALPQTVSYLKGIVQSDGGVPFVKPFDIFESAWSLNHLLLGNVVRPDHADVRRITEFLAACWSNDRGVRFTPQFPVEDLDDTAVTFSVLNWAGYQPDAGVFGSYEEKTFFRCYPDEADVSLSVNIRTLAALRRVPNYPRAAMWIEKVLRMLHEHDAAQPLLTDKWQISPYYLIPTMIWSVAGLDDDFLRPHVKWLLKTQRADGGWGYFGFSTAEETAYCLQALLNWDRLVERVDAKQIDLAAYFLMSHVGDDDFPGFWTGKGLFRPKHIVRTGILMALTTYLEG